MGIKDDVERVVDHWFSLWWALPVLGVARDLTMTVTPVLADQLEDRVELLIRTAAASDAVAAAREAGRKYISVASEILGEAAA